MHDTEFQFVAAKRLNLASHLTYSKTEDRLIVSTDDEEQVDALTRRLTREMVEVIAKIVAQQKSATTGGNDFVRDTVLNFELSNAVSEAYADGGARRSKRKTSDAALSKLALAVDISAKKSGGVTLAFRDGGNLLTLALDARGIYVLIAAIVDIAVSARRDLPEVAAWLEPTPSRGRSATAESID